MRQTLVKWDASACAREALPLWKQAIRYLASLAGKNVFEPQWIAPPNSAAANHPGCIEVIEIGEDSIPRVTYKRN